MNKIILLIIIGLFAITGYSQQLDKFGQPLPPNTISAEDIPEDSGFVAVDGAPVSLPEIILPTVEIPSVFIVSILTPEIMETLFDNSLMISDYLNALKWPVDYKPQVVTPADIINAEPVKPEISLLDQKFDFKGQLNALDSGIKAKIADSQSGIPEQQKFIKEDHPKNFIGDKRTVKYLPSKEVTASNKVWKSWKQVYSQDYPRIKYVRVPDITKIKMVAEMQVAKNQMEKENLYAELNYFKALGFNTVLAVWEGDQVNDFIEQIIITKGMGFKVFFTFGTKESLSTKIFIDPEKYKQGLMSLASTCDGYLIGWRRTSLHLFNPDKKWIDFSLDCVRKGNPEIPVFGEVYRGYAGNNNPDGSYNENEFLVNIPTNSSGAFVVNFGFLGVRPEGVLKLVRAVSDVPLISLIVGERPYYMTRASNKKSKIENRELITKIENRFKKYDFGIATLAGDGSNGNYDKNVSDNLCMSHWSK